MKSQSEVGLEIYSKNPNPYFMAASIEGCRGEGCDLEYSIALAKSLSELEERKVVNKLLLENSSGVATHVDRQKAEENALCELIERDAFLIAWFCKSAPVWLSKIEVWCLGGRVKKLVKSIRRLGIKTKVGILSKTSGRITAAILLTDNLESSRFGMFYTAASNLKLQEAVYSGLLEAYKAGLSIVSNQDIIRFSENKLKSTDPADPNYHFLHWVFKRDLKQIQWLLKGSSKYLELKSFETKISVLRKGNDKKPWTVRAYSSDCQSLFFGSTRLSSLNMKRIDDHGLKVLNFDLHPMS